MHQVSGKQDLMNVLVRLSNKYMKQSCGTTRFYWLYSENHCKHLQSLKEKRKLYQPATEEGDSEVSQTVIPPIQYTVIEDGIKVPHKGSYTLPLTRGNPGTPIEVSDLPQLSQILVCPYLSIVIYKLVFKLSKNRTNNLDRWRPREWKISTIFGI